MKVVKRDGRIVEYDINKIYKALEKANTSVTPENRISPKEINSIIKYIEKLDKKSILVEDIQDIIEIKLMQQKKYILAKKYIVYRYNRALVRKQNTTDETILGLIRNSSTNLNDNNHLNTQKASHQRNLLAKEVSKDLTERLLLPSKITKAIKEGKIYFHNSEYFLQPIFNSSILNVSDMFENSTVINNHLIETPKSFLTACNVLTQIIFESSSCQYGNISINIGCLGKYLHKSHNKHQKELQSLSISNLAVEDLDKIVEHRIKDELKNGIQAIIYQLNTLKSLAEDIKISLFINIDEQDEYLKEQLLVYKELLSQRKSQIKGADGSLENMDFFEIIYVLSEENYCKSGKYYYLTEQIIDLLNNNDKINVVSGLKMKKIYHGQLASPLDDNLLLPLYKDKKEGYKFAGRFNQGLVTINLPQVALESRTEDEFFELLKNRLNLAIEALLCKHYALLSPSTLISPIHYEYGGITRSSDKLNLSLFKKGYSTLNIGYFGLNETLKIMHKDYQNDKEFAIKILKFMKSTCDIKNKETNLYFNISGITDKNIINYCYQIDKNTYDNLKCSKYSESFYCDKLDDLEKLEFEKELQDLTTGGSIITLNDIEINDSLMEYAYNNILYLKIDNTNFGGSYEN